MRAVAHSSATHGFVSTVLWILEEHLGFFGLFTRALGVIGVVAARAVLDTFAFARTFNPRILLVDEADIRALWTGPVAKERIK